jgi:WD40 repeat protein/serine/threonine protein kinase
MSDPNASEIDPIGQIADEFVEAIRHGKRPSVEEFARRYPTHADEIREMLPALVLMEQAKSADDSSGRRRLAGSLAAVQSLRQLGDYQILREVGRGGMGVVYEARQLSLGRHVAIKVLPSHALLDPRQLGRFQREARSAAKLHHTNIVPIFGVGEQDGLHYYVMQFIPGLGLDVVLQELRRLRLSHDKRVPTQGDTPDRLTKLTSNVSAMAVARSLLSGEFCRSDAARPVASTSAEFAMASASEGQSPSTRPNTSVQPADTSGTIHLPGQSETSTLSESGRQYWQSAARVGMQVADALAHAASQGVLHRDIKPSNLLLDETGNVWVTDFGLAKAQSDSDDLTRTGDVIGTLRYMAPERFSGQGDLRSDVYSLGLTLYELLVLRTAFDETDRNKLVKQVMHDAPVRPRKLNPAVPRDLETVILKAIAREPAHRYQTPAEMAADLNRFVEDRPVKARRVSEAEKVWRWCRRNPLPASLLAAVAILLVGVASVATMAAIRIAGARDEADKNAREALEAKENEGAQRKLADTRAQESRQRLIQMYVANGTRLLDDGDLIGALPWLTEALALEQGDRSREERHRIRISAVLAQTPRLVHLWNHANEIDHVAFSPDGRRIVTASKDHTAQVWDVRTGEAVGPPLRHSHFVRKAAFSPDGRRVVTASIDRTARVWDARNAQAVTPPLRHDDSVDHASFSPDGRWVVTGSVDGTARLWDAVTGQPRTAPLKHASWICSVSFSPNGRQVVTASNDHTAQVWETATGRPVAPPLVHRAAVKSAAFSPDGRQVLTASEDHSARLWDAATSQPIGPPLEHGDIVIRAFFSPDGRYVSTCSMDTTARVWQAATGRPVSPPLKHRNSVHSAFFSPDSRYVVTRSNDHTARVWEAATGEAVTPPLWHSSLVTSACFSPDGRRVITASADWTVRMWELGLDSAPLTLRHGKEVSYAAFSPDGSLLATASADGTAYVWSVISGQPVTGPLRHNHEVIYACFSADGRRLLTGSRDHTARMWDTATGRELIPPLRHDGRVLQVTFSPDGSRILTASTDRTAQVWDARTGAPLGPRLQHRDRLYSAVFSPDGGRVVTGSGDGTARVWDAVTGAPRTPPLEHQGAVEDASFSPDGRQVVTASADYTARVWDAETGTLLGEPLRHGAGVAAASFSPDGRRVVTGSRQGTARVWDVPTGAPATPLLKHGRGQIRVVFSPDGRRLATGGGDYEARLWDAATGEALGPPLRHRGWVLQLAFSPDGRHLATVCQDGAARIWNLPGPDRLPLNDLVLLAQVLSTQRVDARDGLVQVEAAAQRQALEELRSRYPADFASSVPEALAWHQRETEACLREKNGPAALFHLLHSRWEWWLSTSGRLP